jgi:flagellar M-ring protein FliF
VKDAVGYDEHRGDSVNVVNASFTQDTTPAPDGELVSAKIWESPLFLDIAKIVGGLVVLLVLVLSVIRPLVKNLIAPTAQQMQVQVLSKQAAAALGASPAEASNTPALPSASQQAAASHEQQVAQARTLVTQDPKRVAQVVKGWVANDD